MQDNAGGSFLRFVRPKVVEAADAAALEVAVETWLNARTEERLVAVVPVNVGTAYAVLILYTD